MRISRPSLTFSIMAFLGCLLLVTWFLFSLIAFRTAANDLYAQKLQLARTQLATFVSNLPDTVFTYTEKSLPSASLAVTYAQKLSEDNDFIRLSLVDINNRCIYTSGREGSDILLPFSGVVQTGTNNYVLADGSGVAWVVPVKRDGMLYGRAGLVLSLDSEKNRLNRSRQLYLAYFVLDFILLLGLGSYILTRIVVTPVNRLLTATEKIIDGNYGQRVRVSGSAELAELGESFNTMSATLNAKDEQVKSHVVALETANSELRQAREEALRTEKMASIGLLAAGMAHEIGTPLASIMGYAELMSNDELDATSVRDYARRISQDSSRIDRIVRGLLDYARPSTGENEPVDVRQVVLDTIELLSQQGVFKNISVSTQFDGSSPTVLADSCQLQQVLINLMVNGRDAMPEGGELSVAVAFVETGFSAHSSGSVRIDVNDSGSGIPEENIASIFDPFFTTKPPGRGTGLGLAISGRIIEGLGGRISVESHLGEGSRFSVWLPVCSGKEA